MIEGSGKRKRQLAYELQNQRVFEKRSKKNILKSSGLTSLPCGTPPLLNNNNDVFLILGNVQNKSVYALQIVFT